MSGLTTVSLTDSYNKTRPVSLGFDYALKPNHRLSGILQHQDGSITCMSWNDVQEWMVSLNNNGFAGYHDCRLPTVEEAALLLESSKKNDLYIHPIFSNKQQWIWTGDKFGSEAMWHVNFSYGSVYWGLIISSYIFSNVRLVRSGE